MNQTTTTEFLRGGNALLTEVPNLGSVRELKESNRAEVLNFLAIRPVHTVAMSSFITDNGVESPLNRGIFYGCRDLDGNLEGVALIGHATLIEARTEESLKAFAFVAKAAKAKMHLVMAGGSDADLFWSYYDGGTRRPRLSCTELLFEVAFPFPVLDCKWNIRPAAHHELEQVADAHAAIAFMESGVDPMFTDREGFLKRTSRRIEQGRTFVVYDGETLVFKADIVAETADVIYLEGIYVAPRYRGTGVGSSCLSALTLRLLKQAKTVCLLSNINFIDAHLSYLKAGYRNTDSCTTLFV